MGKVSPSEYIVQRITSKDASQAAELAMHFEAINTRRDIACETPQNSWASREPHNFEGHSRGTELDAPSC